MALHDDETGVTLLDSQVPFMPGVLPPKVEKFYMNPIRYRTNYRTVPCFIVICVVCLALVIILGTIDDQKFMPIMIALFALLGVAMVWLLRMVPKTREQEMALELERYDFDTSQVEEQEIYRLELEGLELEFSENGLKVDGRFHWYNPVSPRLVVTNRFNRVWLAIRFGGADDLKALFVPLSPVLLKAVESLPIPLENPQMFAYLLTHKENAFAQIYKYGTFQVFED